MQNPIGDNGNTPEKLRELAEQLIEPNAAIRVGRSIITQNTAGSLDLVINSTFISLVPDIEAVYFLRMKKDKSGQEILPDDRISLIWDVPDLGMGVSQMSKAGYTYLINNEKHFLECAYGINETQRIYSKKHSTQDDKNNIFSFESDLVENNRPGSVNMIVDDIYVSLNRGVKAVYFMSAVAEHEVEWSLWWDLFCDVTENGIAVVQRSKAGFIWWVYDEKAYEAKCERNGGLDPTQFTISPNNFYK